MPKQFDNTNRGVLFKNHDKKEENHPDYKGRIDVGGTEYWLSAWIKTSDKGTKFMSLSVTEKQATQQAKQRNGRPAPEDNVPF